MIEIVYIPTVEAKGMPSEVLDYCADREWSTHCDNSIVQLEDDGNPFAEWLKSNGHVFKWHKNKDWNDIGIFAT